MSHVNNFQPALRATRHFTGKERDSESGLDYFGARYNASSMGRWISPDLINLTDDRVRDPANTLNKYVYGGNNPLKFIDPDGRDITIFYDPGGFAGHTILLSDDPQSGVAAAQSFGPASHSALTRMGELVNAPVAGTNNYDFSSIGSKSADQLRQDYSILTIKTSPEVTAQVYSEIQANLNAPPGQWVALSNNCTTTCAAIVRKLQLSASTTKTPFGFFEDIYDQYGNGTAKFDLAGGHYQFQNGRNYGRGAGSLRYNPFDILRLTAQRQLHEHVTIRICHDENGKLVCVSQ